ncbi:MAG: type II secretion system major pseudopilin GspG [Planctomycetaceae bacterium]|nr:type II secretion system major pseudopilin GspG [Planctomycetaceae bacterium]
MKRICKNRGFTLVEIMAVLLIIGLLAGIAAKNFMGQTEKAKVTVTKATLKNLHAAVNMFKLDTGVYPSEDVGLIELIEQPADLQGWNAEGYLEGTDVPRDAWKNDFVYMLNPENGKPFVIISYGADGKEGGEGNDMDLWSTDVD